MYPYEGMFLVDPVQHAANPEAVEGTVRKLLEKHGATIQQFDRWDERKLAYEIKGHKRGVYLLTLFEMPGENVDALRQETRIIDPILRNLVIRLDSDIPAYLERSAAYYDKMREEGDSRRGPRGDRRDDDDRDFDDRDDDDRGPGHRRSRRDDSDDDS